VRGFAQAFLEKQARAAILLDYDLETRVKEALDFVIHVDRAQVLLAHKPQGAIDEMACAQFFFLDGVPKADAQG
jgi:hypothetical protein